MAGTVEQKLTAQGIILPDPRTPVANYVGFVRTGNLLFVSGQVCFNAEGKLIAKGKLAPTSRSSRVTRPRAAARSICSRRSRPRSAISTRWSAWSGLVASSIRRRISSTAPRCSTARRT